MSQVRKINDEVYVAETTVVTVDEQMLLTLKEQAFANPRCRARVCAHRSPSDRLHEMLIVLTDKVYVRPHRHIAKSESFHVIEGTVAVFIFEPDGRVRRIIQLEAARSGKPFFFRMEDECFHAPVVTSPCVVFHETTNGPFNRADTEFAPWAPEENDSAACVEYVRQLKAQLTAGIENQLLAQP